MSLNKLLSVGRSFVGIRDQKSPFEMRKDCLLPIFDTTPRLVRHEEAAEEEGGPVQTDWLEPQVRPQPALTLPSSVPPMPATPVQAAPKPPGRSWWSVLTFGLFDRKRPAASLATALIQPELSLDRVRVVRNDLHDSDLELVLKKRPQARKASVAASSPPRGEDPKLPLVGRLVEAERH